MLQQDELFENGKKLRSTLLIVFFWIGVLAVVPYLLLVAYGAYGCPEQNLRAKYNANW
jgi:hypothetical protein